MKPQVLGLRVSGCRSGSQGRVGGGMPQKDQNFQDVQAFSVPDPAINSGLFRRSSIPNLKQLWYYSLYKPLFRVRT